GMPVVMANFVGPGRRESAKRFWGGSRVVDPQGHELVRAGDQQEELIVGDVDYDAVRAARIRLPTVRDSNIELVRREITRLSAVIGVPDFYDRP
ncbi:MAG: nitrilase, partial [Actinomycetia bacterium]|nr:nitrilase [Actinomycetes bacterium]